MLRKDMSMLDLELLELKLKLKMGESYSRSPVQVRDPVDLQEGCLRCAELCLYCSIVPVCSCCCTRRDESQVLILMRRTHVSAR